eukprot:1186440-Prymnesium_polylepis.1
MGGSVGQRRYVGVVDGELEALGETGALRMRRGDVVRVARGGVWRTGARTRAQAHGREGGERLRGWRV